jgi:predicted phage terminase large subunit-like protein
MLQLPPRHGKSELASRRFPAWYLGQNPDHQFLSFSASGDFAAEFGRDVRGVMASEEYATLFDTRLAEDSKAKGRWHTNKGGVYYAVGVDGSVMGKGAHVALIDDPFGSIKDALSEATRENIWRWYTGTVYNRLMPGGAIVIINHRMHEDDLCGRLLEQEKRGGDKWEVVKLPAINPKGEALWPEAYPIEALNRIKAVTLPRDWSALYQQEPAPDTGSFYKREWFKNRYTVRPDVRELRIYGASDYATKEGRGDYTVHLVVGVDKADNIYLLDVVRKQETSDIWVDDFCDICERWKPMKWAEPRDQINNALGPFIIKRLRERRVYVNREQFAESRQGDKEVRSRSMQGRAAMGKVILPEPSTSVPWLADFEAELFSFPAGKNDDQADAFGLIGRMLDDMLTPHQSQRKDDRKKTGWAKAFADRDGPSSNWKVG